MAKRKSIAETQNAKTVRGLKASATAQYKAAIKEANAARRALKEAQRKIDQQKKHELAGYRRKLAALKKAGILKPDFDTRSAPLTKKLQNKIEEYKDVANGRATLKKAPKVLRDKAKAVGYKTHGTRIVIPRIKGERVYISKKDGQIYKRLRRGPTRLKIIPVLEKPQNFHEWILQQEKITGAEDAPKDKRRYGFKIFGHDGYVTFSTTQQLINYLVKYTSTIDEDDVEELLDNLVVIVMTVDEAEKFDAVNKERRRINKLNRRASKASRARNKRIRFTAYDNKQKIANAMRKAKRAAAKKKMAEDFARAAKIYNEQKNSK